MSKSNDRNGRTGRRSKGRQGPQGESPLDQEPFAAKVERFRRLLAELIASRIIKQRRGAAGSP